VQTTLHPEPWTIRGKSMDSYKVVLSPTTKWTRVLVSQGPDELLRAILPPPSQVRHERAAATLLEGLSLWLDTRLAVALSVDAKEAGFCLGLTDELGMGGQSVFLPRRRGRACPAAGGRGTRIRGVG